MAKNLLKLVAWILAGFILGIIARTQYLGNDPAQAWHDITTFFGG